MVRYSHLFKNFPQFVVIHIVKGFSVVKEAEVDVFLELSCFFNDPAYVGNLTSLKAGKVVLYSHLFKNFPQFAVIQAGNDFSIVNETEIDVFL